MPRFFDYHRTVIGYHGTSRSVAERIVLRPADVYLARQSGRLDGEWRRFREYGPKQAWWWAET